MKNPLKIVTFPNFTAFCGINSKNYMKQMALLEPITPKAFVCFMNEYGKRFFTYFKDWETAFKLLPFYNKKRFVNEIIVTSQPCKPHLDVERMFKQTQTDDFKLNLIAKIKKDIIHIFEIDYNKIITESDIKLSDSSNFKKEEYKLSFHFTVSTANQLLFRTNSKKLENCAYHLAKRLVDIDPSYKDYIDQGIYTLDRCMRTIFLYKSQTDLRQLLPINYDNDNENIMDYLVTGFDLDKTYEFIEVPYQYNAEKAKKIKEKNEKSQKIGGKELISDDITIKKIVKMIKENVHKSAFLENVNTSENGNLIYSFNYKNRLKSCPISNCNHKHDRLGFFAYINELDLLEIRCRSDKCKKYFLPLGYVNEEDITLFADSALRVNVDFFTDETNCLKPNIIDAFNNSDHNKIKILLQNWFNSKNIKSMAHLFYNLNNLYIIYIFLLSHF